MTKQEYEKILSIIDNVFDISYPKELEEWNVKGRKQFRKDKLKEAIKQEFNQ